jgi:hypothetical protein
MRGVVTLVSMLLAVLLVFTVGSGRVWLRRRRRLGQHTAAFGFPIDVEYLEDNPEALAALRTRIKKVFLLSTRIQSGDGLAMFWRYLVFVTDDHSSTPSSPTRV